MPSSEKTALFRQGGGGGEKGLHRLQITAVDPEVPAERKREIERKNRPKGGLSEHPPIKNLEVGKSGLRVQKKKNRRR